MRGKWIVEFALTLLGSSVAGQFGKDASGKDVSGERIWTAVTFLTHLDPLPPVVAAEWNKKSNDEACGAFLRLIELCRTSGARGLLAYRISSACALG